MLNAVADHREELFTALFGAGRSNAGPDRQRDSLISPHMAPGGFTLDDALLNPVLASVSYGELNHDDVEDIAISEFAETPAGAVHELLKRARDYWKVVVQPAGWTVIYETHGDTGGRFIVIHGASGIHIEGPLEHCSLLGDIDGGGRQTVVDVLYEIVAKGNELLGEYRS